MSGGLPWTCGGGGDVLGEDSCAHDAKLVERPSREALRVRENMTATMRLERSKVFAVNSR